ncbi:RTA1 like domain-containing protein [Trichoderma austrokoningii]
MSTTVPGPPGSSGGLITFGPHANCTLDLCPIEYSVYKYRPSVAANATFVALFGLSILVHIILGIRWRQWNFMALMIVGCLVEIGGYAGRLILYNNPFSFGGFMDQIVLITIGPVFYTAGIYITLSKTINYLAPEVSRIKPELLYWIFIPVDIICLILQAAGGAISVVSSGSSSTGVDIAMAGLGLQVGGLFFFSVLFVDYLTRYVRKKPESPLSTRMRIFFGFLGAAILLIFVRCVYRCYELSKGYIHSNLITDQGLFIGLEGVLVIMASFCLFVGHPGFVFGRNEAKAHSPPMYQEEHDHSDSKA